MSAIVNAVVSMHTWGWSTTYSCRSAWNYVCTASSTSDWATAGLDLMLSWYNTGLPTWLACFASDYGAGALRLENINSTLPFDCIQMNLFDQVGTYSGTTAASGVGAMIGIKYRNWGHQKKVQQTIYLPGMPDDALESSQMSASYLSLVQTLAVAINTPLTGTSTTWELWPGKANFDAPNNLVSVSASSRLTALRRRQVGA